MKLVPHFDPELVKKFKDETMHPRRHPGRVLTPAYKVPEKIYESIKKVLEDESIACLRNDAIILTNYLQERLRPVEQEEVAQKAQLMKDRVAEKYNISNAKKLSPKVIDKAKKEVVKSLLRHTYIWTAMDFSGYLCYTYLVGRSAAEYAIVSTIFAEINKRDPSFQPKSVFDFGSGVGTVIWASHGVWEDSIEEYYCVDSSSKMQDISRQILALEQPKKRLVKAQVYFRQFLPISSQRKYNIVVSAFSLLELPDAKSRLETLSNLWDKTQDYLVLVELGTHGGFQVINEARDFLLGLFSKGRKHSFDSHVFAPCPHDMKCPKMSRNEKCFFQKAFIQNPFDNKERRAKETYSYVVLKKGKREPDDPQWPRILEPVLVRTEHSHCRICTAHGTYEDICFSKSRHEKLPYWSVRMSEWGDRLPITDFSKVPTLSNEPPELIPKPHIQNAQPSENADKSQTQEVLDFREDGSKEQKDNNT